MGFRSRMRKGYRRVFGHRSPYRRVYGSRRVGPAIGVTYRQLKGPAHDLAKLAAEVRGIKKQQNVEKKHHELVLTDPSGDETLQISQVNGNNEGAYALDITPSISQGIQHDQRIGNSMKMTGMSFKYQIDGQSNTWTKRRIKFTLVKVHSPDVSSVSTTEVINMMYDVNPLTNVRDTNAPLNYTTLKQNGITVIRQVSCYLPDSTYTHAGLAVEAQVAHKTGQFSIALQDIIRYASASATTPEGFKYLLILQGDVGNRSQSNSTKTDIPVTSALTGANVRLHCRYWWVDN
jgi:hypothetical protein